MRPGFAILTTVVFLFAATSAGAQEALGQFGDAAFAPTSKLPKEFRKLGDVKFEVIPSKAKRNETVLVKLTIEIDPLAGGHTYPFYPTKYPGQTEKNGLSLPKPSDPEAGGLIFLGKVVDPTTPELKEKQRQNSPNDVKDQFYASSVTWEFKAVVSPQAPIGVVEVGLGKTRLQVCDEVGCYPAFGNKLPTASFEVLEGTSDKVNPADLAAAMAVLEGRSIPGQIGPANVAKQPVQIGPPAVQPAAATNVAHSRKVAKSIEEYSNELKVIQAAMDKSEAEGGINGNPNREGLGGFVLTAAIWGLISLITPCVFPMIPITVSIFLKHAQGSLKERLKLAGVYCLTIISVLGVSAFALLKFMAWLSANPVTNILLGLLFLALALSLFGMYEIMLPNFLASRLQAKQARGGVVGTVFGALAFTVISFTCVAPFLGGFAGISSADAGNGSLISMPSFKEIAGGLAFATAFAAPFFVLALIPGLLKALPKSGGWLDSVKVVMGFLELAAALKFLRTAEIRLLPATEYFTYEMVLSGWVAICIACGLYLMNVYRLPHDEEKPNIGVMRLLFALLFLGLGLYLMPALFKGADGKAQRPSGTVYSWVESFLLPEVENDWSTDLKDTIERSRSNGQPIFLDFTGETCTNCKYNEHTVFTRPEIRLLLEKFEPVQLYTDEVPEHAYAADPGKDVRNDEGRANGTFQDDAFKKISLPLYAVLVPQADGKVKLLGTREGKINDPSAFAAWLKGSLEKAKK